MKDASYLGIALHVAGIRKAIATELELPGDLELTITSKPDGTQVRVHFKHARKGTTHTTEFKITELQRLQIAHPPSGIESIAKQIIKAMPELEAS